MGCDPLSYFNKLYEKCRAPSGAVTTLDPLFDPTVIEKPYEYFAQLREHDPLREVEGTGTFLVTRMDLIPEVIADTPTFSSDTIKFLHLDGDGRQELWSASSELVEGLDVPMVLAPADPPDHTRQRKVLSRLFTKSAIEARERDVRALVNELLDPHLGKGAMEWMGEAAIPLPAVVLSRPARPHRRCGRLWSETSGTRRANRSAASPPSNGAARSKRSSLISAPLRRTPTAWPVPPLNQDQDTVIGLSAQAVASGRLEDIEALIILLLLLSHGSESTTSLIGAGVAILAEDQVLQERLRAAPALVETFVEEACRVDPPFRGHYRRVTRDTELAGVHLPAEARLVLVWPTANHDGSAFENPEAIDVERAAPRRHVGFGWGIHLYPGAPLTSGSNTAGGLRAAARSNFSVRAGRGTRGPSAPPEPLDPAPGGPATAPRSLTRVASATSSSNNESTRPHVFSSRPSSFPL